MKMENEIQVEAFPRRVLCIMRVLFIMIKKGVSKRKLLLHLNLLLKRSKIAGKANGDVIFNRQSDATAATELFEFSCSNTPAHHKFLFKRKQPKANSETQFEEIEDDGDCHVDEAAEEFIMRFYSQLRMQSLTDG